MLNVWERVKMFIDEKGIDLDSLSVEVIYHKAIFRS